jgi:pyruvate/2-oxoglutarate dehydrogenase complex dihydrolipoamide dehydrogenase (E3) component
LSSNKFGFIVLGGGSTGLTAARFANDLGTEVLLVEKNKIGGDCTWTGCVPSKTLIKAANVAHEMRTADRFGLPPIEPTVDLSKVMNHVQDVIQEVYEEETPERLQKQGIEVLVGTPTFVDSKTISINNQEIVGDKFLICTGAHPFIPPIEGLSKVDFHTYETIFSLSELPKRLIVIGGGPIGCELSQAFSRLGSQVTILTNVTRLMPRDEPEASDVIQRVFEKEGIKLHFNSEISKVWQKKDGIHVQDRDNEIVGDVLLIAVGRRPNIENLALENAKVDYSDRGILVDQKLRTSQKHIFAAGDCVADNLQFTHYAGFQGWIATRNALLPGSSTGQLDAASIPWTTFTSPEIAHVGVMEHEAKKKDSKVKSYFCGFDMVDRARTDDNTDGFLKIILKNDGTIIGATIVSARAGESLQEWVAAIKHELNISDIANHIHVYPTYTSLAMDMAATISVESFLSSAKGKIVRFFA